MIQVFVTGGTFDKEYNYLTGELFFKDTHLMEMFERGRCAVDIDIKTLMMVDSLEMRDEDRAIIVYNCSKTPARRILLTHGTDRMVETARLLAESNIEGKTIVLTNTKIIDRLSNNSVAATVNSGARRQWRHAYATSRSASMRAQ